MGLLVRTGQERQSSSIDYRSFISHRGQHGFVGEKREVPTAGTAQEDRMHD